MNIEDIDFDNITEEELTEFLGTLTEEEFDNLDEEIKEKIEQQLNEFKADGEDSETADPVNTGSTSRPQDKMSNGEKTPIPQGSSKMTKMSMITNIINSIHGMKKGDLSNVHKMVIGGGESSPVPQGSSHILKGIKQVTNEDLDIEQDIKELFKNDTTLTEAFKEKATILFENAVLTKINEVLKEIEPVFTSSLQEEYEELQEELVNKLDSYLDYIVEQWLEDNKLSVEAGIRTEIAEEFMSGLKNLFEETYITMPEDKVDVLENTVSKIEELEEELNEQIEKNIELKNLIEVFKKQTIVETAASDLTEAHASRLFDLASNVDFISEEDFEEKVELLKENYFSKADHRQVVIDDDLEELVESNENPNVDPNMARYVSAISKNKG